MEEKQREQKRAKTTRSDYLADVDELQAWMRESELKVQDRSCEPAKMMENLRQTQNELPAVADKLERLTKNGKAIMETSTDEEEKRLIAGTVATLTEQLAQVKSWLDEKKQLVGDTLDAWQRFLALLEAVKAWTAEKRVFLSEPLKLASLNQARQRLHEYATAVKSCKQVNKNLSDMGRELESIGQVTNVGNLPQMLTEAEEAKVEVEGQLLERNALLQETSEEWEQCERKMKDVKVWMEKARQSLESAQNKKKPLRDQHAIREKMLSDVAIQKTKITMSVEKLQVHFRSGIGGDNRVVEAADELINELQFLNTTIKEQTVSLEICLSQLDQYQQEIQQLRQQIVQAEQQLRTVLSPTYLPNDREKATQEQQDKIKHDIDDLHLAVRQLEGALKTLPRDNLQSVISTISTILADLRYYNQEACRIDKEFVQMVNDSESKKLKTSITEIRKNLSSLLSEAERGQSILERAREKEEKRKQEIRAYKQCLGETEAWIKHITLTINDDINSLNYQVLQEEISFRLQCLIELESMTEVSLLAKNLKEALQDMANNVLPKLQLMVEENEPLAQIETANSTEATLDRESSADSSLENLSPSLADVSLQTGQSLIQETIIYQPKQEPSEGRSAAPLPISTACQTSDSAPSPVNSGIPKNSQVQERIKVLKSIDGNHDVIEIATQNILPPHTSQDQQQDAFEGRAANSDDIVVDMRYQDAPKQEDVTSELSIQHLAPQSFETVLMEPDDVTTEVVVDSDGTKRIIVRKLRRTLITNRHTVKQHVSQLSTKLGDGPPVVQAFSEATMKGQQLTVTRTKPDGMIEMESKQSYGSKVVTGTPGDELHVEEYQSPPEFSHQIIQGDLTTLSPNPPEIDEALEEGTEYHTKTSTVHAVVQQVTRKVIRKTRRVIRKVTIIDGKEVTSEEIVEDPEEVEIDEQDIPHISINVVKSEDQNTFQSGETLKDIIKRDFQNEDNARTVKIETLVESRGEPSTVIKMKDFDEGATPIKVELQSPERRKSRKSRKKKSKTSADSQEDSPTSDKTYTIEDETKMLESKLLELSKMSMESLSKSDGTIRSDKVKEDPKDKHEPEYTGIEVKVAEPSALNVKTDEITSPDKCAIFQTPIDESCESTTKDVSSLESTSVGDIIPTITKTSCKFEDASVGKSFPTHDNKLESGTVDVEEHTGIVDKRTVDVDDDNFQSALTDIPQKEWEELSKGIEEHTTDKVVVTKLLDEERKGSALRGEISAKEKPIVEASGSIEKIDISLSIRDQEDLGNEPLVSVQSHVKRTGENVLAVSDERVSIQLPADRETVELVEANKAQASTLVTEPSEISEKNASKSKRNKKKKRKALEKINDEGISDEESSASPVTTVVLDEPEDDEQKPDAATYEITESSDAFSTQKDESFGVDGYEADQRTTVEEMPPEFEVDAGKRKKKKKKKQKTRLSKDEDIESPRDTANEMKLENEAEYEIREENKTMKKPSKKRKRKKGDVDVNSSDDDIPELSDATLNEADSQAASESCDVSTVEIIPKASTVPVNVRRTSSELDKLNKSEADNETQTLKQETKNDMQTLKQEKVSETQTQKKEEAEGETQTLAEVDEKGKKVVKQASESETQTPKKEEAEGETQTLAEDAEKDKKVVKQASENETQTQKKEEAESETQTPKKEEAEGETQTLAEEAEKGKKVVKQESESETQTQKKEEAESQTQTQKKEETESETQTSSYPVQDTAPQTPLDLNLDKISSFMQTHEPYATQTAEIALQTTPRDDKDPISLLETDKQTAITEVETLENQTLSPKSKLITEEMGAQTTNEFLRDSEQQTILAPVIDIKPSEAISTETQEDLLVEKPLLIHRAISPGDLDRQDFNVQVDRSNKTGSHGIESQTAPAEPEQVETMIQTGPAESTSPSRVEESLTLTDRPIKIDEVESEVGKVELPTQTKANELASTVQQSVQFVPDSREINPETVPVSGASLIEAVDNNTVCSDNVPLEEKDKDGAEARADKPKSYPAVKDVVAEGEKPAFESSSVTTPIKKLSTKPLDVIDVYIKSLPLEDQEMDASEKVGIESVEITEIESLPLEVGDDRGSITADEGKMEKASTPESTSDITTTSPRVEMPVEQPTSGEYSKESEVDISSRDVNSMSDTSFELQIQATVEVCDSTTPDLSSQNVTIAEEPSERESLKAKRQRRKRQRNRTIEKLPPAQPEAKVSNQDTLPLEEGDLGRRSQEKEESVHVHQSTPEPLYEIGVAKSTINAINDPSIAEAPLVEDVDTIDFIDPTGENAQSPKDIIVKKTERTKLMLRRSKSSPNLNKRTCLPNIIHISKLEKSDPEKLNETKILEMPKNLEELKEAVEQKNSTIVEQIFVTVVETLSTWLENIESKIYLNKETPTDLAQNNDEINEFKNEINNVRGRIHELNDIWAEAELSYPQQEREKLKQYIQELKSQAVAIEEVAENEEMYYASEITKWNQFLNELGDLKKAVEKQQEELSDLINKEMPALGKVEELDKIESANFDHMDTMNRLTLRTKELLHDYPDNKLPPELNATEELIRSLEHVVSVEREKLLQVLALAEEYEQTLQEFSQITKIAENLLDSPISVMSLEQLREEMQKHRKFFVNLNYCRAILESLEDNLDPETKERFSEFHSELHNKAVSLLDQASSKAQQMSLAASRWVVLEQGIKEECGWLQVAYQRVPDLKNVTSTEYDQYISLYQNLSLDIANHHGRLIQLLGLARNLQNLINIEDPDDRYGAVLDEIVKLQEKVDSSLKCLLAFRESWSNQEMLVNRLENWMSRAERELAAINDPTVGNMRQFWEIKAQYEVHNNMRNEADNCFEQALRIVPLSDEMVQRQFHGDMQKRWNSVSDKLHGIQDAVRNNISSEDVPSDEKLNVLEKELHELRTTINEFHGVIKTEEELELYVERLSVLFERVCIIQDELGRLGLLPAAESERVGLLLSTARRLEGQVGEELEAAQVLRERLQNLRRGIARVRKAHERHRLTLDQCEGSERQGGEAVAAAVERCQTVTEELGQLWQEIMCLRQLLHTLPTSMRVTVSPVGVERDISGLQDEHESLEARCAKLLGSLRSRLTLWRRFEKQLETVQQSVQEADYMMELLSVQGSVDYDRLLKATERLEGLNVDFVSREALINELRAAAEPLRESCAAEVSERVDAVVNETVQAWESTRSELGALCDKYQHAVRLWEQYKDSSAAVKAWVDSQMGSVANLPPEEALKKVKICEDTLAEHKERLAELRGLVAQIASDVGLDAGGPLQSDIESLGQRLEDMRETLSTLADTADARALNQELALADICQTRNFLDSVHQSITPVDEDESKEQLELLRNHLLSLSRAESQLNSIKERALELNPTREPSIVEILQLWQRVFRETFQQYHRLSARLVRSQDVATALRLWQEYLTHVQDFLSSSLPGDYSGLSEDRNLCEVHKNLLSDQQQLILTVRSEDGKDLSITEQFNQLTNLHNESLVRIMERHAAVINRLTGWERYRIDQSKLLAWLKDIDKERGRLQLRFIHVRRLEKILQRIETLLNRVPSGESQVEVLQRQQNILMRNCDETVAVSVRMEHAANSQRISNIRASLETWKEFVLRIKDLNDKHAEQTAKITSVFYEINEAIEPISKSSSSSLAETRRDLDTLQKLKTRLIDCTTDLETLGVTTEQLRECLSPTDMKTLNQQSFLLWQQHGDLEHQLALLIYKLGERCNLQARWESRCARLLVWMKDTENRIQNSDTPNLDEPEEALKRLECEVQAEMALKHRELEWLRSNGLELVKMAEPSEKGKLETSLEEINDGWHRLLSAGKSRVNKIVDLMQTMDTLQQRLEEIRAWLSSVEAQISEPYVMESTSQATIDKKLRDHEQLQKSIEAESGIIGEVLNLCEILLSDCDAWKASFNTDAIKGGMEGLERRWKATCVKSSDRKRKIILTGKLLAELEGISDEHSKWLEAVEKELELLDQSLSDLSKQNTEKTMDQAQRIKDDIRGHEPALQILEQCYSRLAKGSLEPDNLKDLTLPTRQLIDRWHGLEPKVNTIIAALQKDQKTYREFISAHGAAVIGLTQVDVMLTQLQHLKTPEEKALPRRRLQQLGDIEVELSKQNENLRRADELALKVMREANPEDVAEVQELVDEYQLLWKDISKRVEQVRGEIEADKWQEVDEAVQVETLKFEQDTAVQVDTLPHLTKMTASDAYLIELEAAIGEFRAALDALAVAASPEPTAGTGLSASARNIAKLIGSCQSMVELIKHLLSLLSEEKKLDKTAEVEELVAEYEKILKKARLREKQIRELNDSGRLTCPLCSNRNWAQLDNDLWRLEKWLEFAEGTQSEQRLPSSDIGELEDIIQDHHEFLLDLDSHKSIVVSLNIVGEHLADHTEDVERADELRDRLAGANIRWNKVCKDAGWWQNTLQAALIDNQQFHRIVEELLVWLQGTEQSIRESEPIDLTDSHDILQAKYDTFKEMLEDLERCEPRVTSLQETANHLLEEHIDIRERLQELRLRLQSLKRLTNMYVLKIGATLGLDPREVGLPAVTSLAILSEDLLEDAGSGNARIHGTNSANAENEGEQTVLTRGYHFIGRVLRASLPIQALMLVLLGAASLVPTVEEDYSCMFARSFTPLIQYPNGPPPL